MMSKCLSPSFPHSWCCSLRSICGVFNVATLFGRGSITVVEPQEAEQAERLAAQEIRRYLYLRTGQLVRDRARRQ